jgi:hypothetical protein
MDEIESSVEENKFIFKIVLAVIKEKEVSEEEMIAIGWKTYVCSINEHITRLNFFEKTSLPRLDENDSLEKDSFIFKARFMLETIKLINLVEKTSSGGYILTENGIDYIKKETENDEKKFRESLKSVCENIIKVSEEKGYIPRREIEGD